MGTFFACSIQSAICLALFYLFYKVLLSRETFHRFNRLALLGILALSFVFPFVLTLFPIKQVAAIQPVFSGLTGELALIVPVGNPVKENGNILLALLLIVYLTGCAICLIYTALSTFRITRIIRNGTRTPINGNGTCTPINGNGTCIPINGNRTKLILLNEPKISPFSWMRYIVCSKSDYEETGETIITHENAHIRYRHSLDLFIAQLCIITQWFNPASWLLYKELQSIHEYEADEEVIRSGVNARQYQLLLIKKAVGSRLYSMANSLNHSNLKKRIAMMYQKKSNPWARLKYAYVLPLAATTVAIFAQPEISIPFDEISNAKVSHFSLETSKNEVKNLPEADIPAISGFPATEEQSREDSNRADVDPFPGGEAALLTWMSNNILHPDDNPIVTQSDEDYIYVTCDIHPEFPGGDAALMKWISENMNYPKEAAENGIEGRVTCQFVVEKDGSITNVQVIRGHDKLLDEEAVRILKILPKFEKPAIHKGKPVRVWYSLPVNFKLSQ
jgi:TonB family protein